MTDNTHIKAPLELDFQREVGIVARLKDRGGRATRRELLNLRPRKGGSTGSVGDWNTALLQLVENDYVAVSGTGKKGDPVTITLLHDLPGMPPEQGGQGGQHEAEDLGAKDRAELEEIRRLPKAKPPSKELTRRLDEELALDMFLRSGYNHETLTGKQTVEFYENLARETYGDDWRTNGAKSAK